MALTLAIGFLVDDAIVFLENTVRRMEKYGERPLLAAAVNGAKEISFTILSMTISLAAVFIPLVLHVGVDGPNLPRVLHHDHHRRSSPSGIVSLTLTPLMCARMLGQRGQGSRRPCSSASSAASSSACWRLWPSLTWFFYAIAGSRAIVWVICLARHG